MSNDLPGGPFLPVQTLVLGHREHVEHHKVLHAWFNRFGGGTGGGGTSRVLARWAWQDAVKPSRGSKEGIDDDATIAAITFSLLLPVAPGRHLLWDLLLQPKDADTGVSIFPDSDPPPPIESDTPNVNGLYVLELGSAVDVKANDVLQPVVTDGGAGRWLVMKVLAGATTGTPTP